MRRRLLIIVSIALLSACSGSTPNTGRPAASARADNSVVGTWELVSTHVTRNDSTMMQGAAPEFRSLKILNNTHYSVITRRADQFLRAGAGRYSLSGDNYVETVELASSSSFTPGAQYSFRIQIEGDTWTLDGGAGSTRLREVWRRVR